MALVSERQLVLLRVAYPLREPDGLAEPFSRHGAAGVLRALGPPGALAALARLYDCPLVGVRAVRLPGHRLRGEVTAPLDMPRDQDGNIDAQGTMQMVTGIVVQWVLEQPEQWMWMHPCWRLSAALIATRGWPHLLQRRGVRRR